MKVTVILLVVIAGLWIMRLASPTPPTPTEDISKLKLLTPAEELAAAKSILATKKPLTPEEVVKAAKHLRAIAPTLPEYKEVPALLRRLSVDQKRIAAEQNRQAKELADKITREGIGGRQKYVEELELEYLKKGYDVHLSAIGPSKTTFNFQYVLVSRPLVYQL